MRAVKKFTSVTKNYEVLDGGPVMEVDPRLVMGGKFRVEYFSITWQDGTPHRMFIRGHRIDAKGNKMVRMHDRQLIPSEFPEWADEFLDMSL